MTTLIDYAGSFTLHRAIDVALVLWCAWMLVSWAINRYKKHPKKSYFMIDKGESRVEIVIKQYGDDLPAPVKQAIEILMTCAHDIGKMK